MGLMGAFFPRDGANLTTFRFMSTLGSMGSVLSGSIPHLHIEALSLTSNKYKKSYLNIYHSSNYDYFYIYTYKLDGCPRCERWRTHRPDDAGQPVVVPHLRALISKTCFSITLNWFLIHLFNLKGSMIPLPRGLGTTDS